MEGIYQALRRQGVKTNFNLMHKDQTISLVIPCFNEEEGIKKILSATPDFVDEIIVVDNNSTDKTAEVAASLGARVVFEAKKGYGRAIWAGVLASRGNIVAVMDGDGNHSLSDVQILLDYLMKNNLEAIWGNRFAPNFKNSSSLLNYFGNQVLSLIFSALVRRRIYDSQSGMMIFRRHFLEKFRPRSIGMAFSEEIKMIAVLGGFKWQEVGINYFPRIGRRKMKIWRSGLCNLIFLFYRRLLYVFSES